MLEARRSLLVNAMTLTTGAEAPVTAVVPGRRVHTLKVLTRFFDDLAEQRKPFEVRYNDREYKMGDVLHLCEYDPEGGFSGWSCYREITYVLDPRKDPIVRNAIRAGYVVLGLDEPEWLNAIVSTEQQESVQ